MRNLLIFIMISILAGVCACSEDPAELIIEPSEPTTEELEAKVIENCYILEAAIEAYKAASVYYHPYGLDIYPPSVSTDPYELGITLLEFLPNGELLENPFTGEKTEPSTDLVATEPGQIGYGVLSLLGANQVYAITGFGQDSLMVLIENIRDVEILVIYDCILVLNAIHQCMDLNNGSFPSENELIALFPEGRRLRNRLTLALTNPIYSHDAAMEGEIGVWSRDGYYRITGFGVSGRYVGEDVTIFNYNMNQDTSGVMVQFTDEIIPILDIVSTFRQYQEMDDYFPSD